MNPLLEGTEFVIFVAYGLLFLAVFLIVLMLLKEEEARAAEEQLEDTRDRESSNPIVKITRPFYVQYVLPLVRRKAYWESYRKKYRRKIISAGLREEITPDEFIALKMFLIVFFPFLLFVLYIAELMEPTAFYYIGSSVGGWFYPDLWVSGILAKRQKQIRKALPFVVDLLALSTEAGMDFVGAIGKVVEKSAPSPLVTEFEQFLKEIKVGSSRSEALREIAARVNMREINSFIAILISADAQGAPIGKILRQQSEQVRNDRFVMAEKQGAKAVPMLTAATIFIVLPAVFLIIVGPYIAGAFI